MNSTCGVFFFVKEFSPVYLQILIKLILFSITTVFKFLP